jgi:predicted ATPase
MAERLRSLCALLLIDNFEQVVDAADVLAALLGQCPAIKCLVTSRCALQLKGEHEHALLPLPLPPAAAAANDLLRFPSVELFTQRVQAVLPDWSLNEDNARSIAGICRRLDGLPLALELAATRMKILSPAALLERLGNQPELLSGGTRDSDDRHQTLQATLDWSYELLSPAAALLFPQLSAFADGWTLDAMTRVCHGGGEIDLLDALAVLIDNSLVWRIDKPAAIRFVFPVTIREYAAGKLRQSGDADAVSARHLTWCLELAETAGPNSPAPVSNRGCSCWRTSKPIRARLLTTRLRRASPPPPTASRAHCGGSGRSTGISTREGDGSRECSH